MALNKRTRDRFDLFNNLELEYVDYSYGTPPDSWDEVDINDLDEGQHYLKLYYKTKANRVGAGVNSYFIIQGNKGFDMGSSDEDKENYEDYEPDLFELYTANEEVRGSKILIARSNTIANILDLMKQIDMNNADLIDLDRRSNKGKGKGKANGNGKSADITKGDGIDNKLQFDIGPTKNKEVEIHAQYDEGDFYDRGSDDRSANPYGLYTSIEIVNYYLTFYMKATLPRSINNEIEVNGYRIDRDMLYVRGNKLMYGNRELNPSKNKKDMAIVQFINNEVKNLQLDKIAASRSILPIINSLERLRIQQGFNHPMINIKGRDNSNGEGGDISQESLTSKSSQMDEIKRKVFDSFYLTTYPESVKTSGKFIDILHHCIDITNQIIENKGIDCLYKGYTDAVKDESDLIKGNVVEYCDKMLKPDLSDNILKNENNERVRAIILEKTLDFYLSNDRSAGFDAQSVWWSIDNLVKIGYKTMAALNIIEKPEEQRTEVEDNIIKSLGSEGVVKIKDKIPVSFQFEPGRSENLASKYGSIYSDHRWGQKVNDFSDPAMTVREARYHRRAAKMYDEYLRNQKDTLAEFSPNINPGDNGRSK